MAQKKFNNGRRYFAIFNHDVKFILLFNNTYNFTKKSVTAISIILMLFSCGFIDRIRLKMTKILYKVISDIKKLSKLSVHNHHV